MTFNGVPCTDLVRHSSTKLTCVTPALEVVPASTASTSKKDVQVHVHVGRQSSIPAKFTYLSYWCPESVREEMNGKCQPYQIAAPTVTTITRELNYNRGKNHDMITVAGHGLAHATKVSVAGTECAVDKATVTDRGLQCRLAARSPADGVVNDPLVELAVHVNDAVTCDADAECKVYAAALNALDGVSGVECVSAIVSLSLSVAADGVWKYLLQGPVGKQRLV